MKYILNETPIKTTNGFRVNNVKVDLDVPDKFSFHEYLTENINIISTDKNDFISNIGLKNSLYKNTKIDIVNNVNELVKLEYIF